jgi:hypothetical protein
MTRRFLSRFRRSQDGNATVEFAIWFSVVIALLGTGVEIAYMNLRHAMLERAVDLAVRDIRLGTGAVPSYEEVRAKICEKARVIDDCTGNVTLEMVEVDPRNFGGFAESADCRNVMQEPRPVRNFVAGRENGLMLLRACLAFKPMMPTTGLGGTFATDADGYAWLVVNAAFVQEPR